jgi:hypothetical protein
LEERASQKLLQRLFLGLRVQVKAEAQVWGQRLKKSLRKSLTKGPSKPLPEALLGFEGQSEGGSLRLGLKTQEESQ